MLWALKIIGHRSFCRTILLCIKRAYVYIQNQSIIHGITQNHVTIVGPREEAM